MLPITPTQYWSMTPAELGEMMEGARWRDEKLWELAAWVTANLINVSGKVAKKTVKPDQLLGRKPKVRNAHQDVEELVRRQAAIDARDAN